MIILSINVKNGSYMYIAKLQITLLPKAVKTEAQLLKTLFQCFASEKKNILTTLSLFYFNTLQLQNQETFTNECNLKHSNKSNIVFYNI